MADHGKNRRRSHHERKRQRIGKFKSAKASKLKTKKLKAWFDYWNNNGPYPELK